MRRLTFQTTLFRYIPGSSPIHRLRASTKIVALIVLTVALSLEATWAAIGVAALFIAVVFLFARLPLSALKIFPAWLVAVLVVGDLVFALFSHTPPKIHFGHISLAVGGVENAAQFLALSFEYLMLLALVGWTTPAPEVAVATARTFGPLRRIGFPLEEFVTTLAIAIRFLPMLLEEIRTMTMARRVRGLGWIRVRSAERFGEVLREAREFALSFTGLAVSRAEEAAVALAARGGYSSVVGVGEGEERRDFVAYLVLVVTAAALIVVGAKA